MPLQDKSHFHILRPTDKFTLGFHALVAYSYLVRRSRLNLPISQRELGRLTGFSPNTLVSVVRNLIDVGLAQRAGYDVIPQADANGLFHVKGKEMKRWEDRYQTIIIYDLAPNAPITASENYILCTILSFNSNGKVPTPSAIAHLLCFSERTVKDKVKGLRRRGLIDHDGLCVTITDESYWLDAPAKAKKHDVINENTAAEVAAAFLAVFPATYEPQFISTMADWEQLMQGHAIKMLRANYSEEDVWHFWSDVQEWGGLKGAVIEKFAVQVFANLFKLAEYHTSLNRSKGAFRGKNSCGLLGLWAKATCIDLLARYNYSGTDGFAEYIPDLEKVKFMVTK